MASASVRERGSRRTISVVSGLQNAWQRVFFAALLQIQHSFRGAVKIHLEPKILCTAVGYCVALLVGIVE